MSVLSPKRVLFSVVVTAVLAANAVANPSPRTYPRMVFDQQAGEFVLFGGSSAADGGTQRSYDSNETWAWTGTRWVQRFPAHAPSGRAGQSMVYDSLRGRVVLFGGRQQTGDINSGEIVTLNDTWFYDNNDWTQLGEGSDAPRGRYLAGLAYDPVRDRVILYGGTGVTEDGLDQGPLYDTWEFDGTVWRKLDDETTKVARPLLVYDKTRNQLLMMGIDTTAKSKMHRFDPATSKWVEMTPEKLPDCIIDAGLLYQDHTGTVIMTGGLCTTIQDLDKTWEWNGTNWTEVKSIQPSRAFGSAFAYDSLRQYALLYGGNDATTSTPRSTSLFFRNGDWRLTFSVVRPSPRSLFAIAPDADNQAVWLMGGLNEYSNGYTADFWGFRGGHWFVKQVKDAPTVCDAPLSAFDTDRKKLVMVCWTTSVDLEVFEFDGTVFKRIESTRDKPDSRRQSALVYDQTLKKVVLFGGYDNQNFKDDTWTWDGANWTEVKKDKPPNRSLHAMWYDPLQKKTIIYGGIGREDIEERATRYSDMWAFNGQGWTKLTVSATPGERMGPQYAIDPATGKLLLFGGMKSELPNPDKETSRVQYYDNETWQWDGAASTWTKLTPAAAPAPRQNGRIAYDPTTQRLMLFGGYAGFYFSDVWYWTGSNWQVLPDTGSERRRATGPPPAPLPIQPPTTTND